ncbi:hypothetical protein ES703_68624 [subsurface metagenome]
MRLLLQRCLHPLALGDVSDNMNTSHNLAFVIEYRRCRYFKMNSQVRFKEFRCSWLFGLNCFFMRANGQRLACPVEHFITVFADKIRGFHVEGIGKSLVHSNKPEILITNGNPISNRVEGCSPFLSGLFYLFLCPLVLGDVWGRRIAY